MEESMAIPARNKRKGSFTDFQFQFKIIGVFIALFIVETALLTVGIYFIALYQRTIETIPNKVMFVYCALLAVLLLMTFINGYIGFRLSHRVTGPLYGFTKSMRSVAEGDLSRYVTLREEDYLQEFEVEYNAMLGSLQRFLREDHDCRERIIAAAGQIKDDINRLVAGKKKKEQLAQAADGIADTARQIGARFIFSPPSEPPQPQQ